MSTREGERPLLELTQEIATHMPGWTAKAGQHDNGACLIAPDGSGVYVYGGERGKLALSGRWPENGPNSENYYPRERHSINVARNRAPLAIASEIKRRLLPAYLPEYAAQVAKRAQHEALANAAEVFAVELGRVLGAKLHGGAPHNDGWSVWLGNATFKVSRWGSIRIELSPNNALALKVAALLTEHEAQAAESAE
jgi:hypothetical protein